MDQEAQLDGLSDGKAQFGCGVVGGYGHTSHPFANHRILPLLVIAQWSVSPSGR
jgi:hypothetical protein